MLRKAYITKYIMSSLYLDFFIKKKVVVPNKLDRRGLIL